MLGVRSVMNFREKKLVNKQISCRCVWDPNIKKIR